jgi:hypothetical protein
MEKKSIFTREVFTECEIDAPASSIYSVISDFANIKNWTNDLTISGDTQPGGKMCVMVNIPNQGWQKLSSKMVRMEEKIISFDNVIIAPFIFIGRHRYEIIPISENKTRFINAEIFSGLALPFLQLRNFAFNVHKYKDDTNLALKKAVETFQKV